MPRSSPPEERPDLANSPVAWFSELLIAVDRGDYRRATKAQRQLRRLGWSVVRCKPRGQDGAR